MDATRSTEGKSKKTSAPAASHGAKPVTLMANAIRALAMDAVEKAGSGHPGAPMGMAEMGVALWDRHMRFNPANPKWPGRDRFVLSNGHASMFQYALLHLTGYDLPMREIENLRQLHSKTPGHPEVGVTAGVETTTGPLGQGIGNAVGMALAEKLLAAEFNRDGHAIVDHHTYVFCGDGCLMEGVSHEAASLAAVWKLNKLVLFYDNNNISIDGHVDPWFHEDTPKRFEAYGWNVIANVEGNDADAVDAAIAQALQSTDKPTLICCKTIIGKGSPNKAGTAKAHGEELGDHEIELTREALDWEWPPFVVPDEVYQAWDHKTRGSAVEAEWNEAFAAYESDHPELAAEFKRRTAGDLPPQWRQVLGDTAVAMHEKAEKVASRKASQQALEVLTGELRELIGGSADLTGSNYTNTSHTPPLRFAEDGGVMRDVEGRLGRHINYGVREFGMAVVMTGMALHGGFIPYGGTFLTFSDYMRNGIRMAALMKERVIYVLTHDSIGLGGDGPTHQSIEHAAALRLIPNLDVWRPCDTLETLAAWAYAVERRTGPSALLLARQGMRYAPKPGFDAKRPEDTLAMIDKGAYVLAEPADAGLRGRPAVVLIATGSEVQLALAAQTMLAEAGGAKVAVRVVSMPSTSVFDRQDAAYKRSVLPEGIPRIAIEMGVTDYWWKYGCAAVVGIDRYGESAPGDEVIEYFGFTAENVAATVRKVLSTAKGKRA